MPWPIRWHGSGPNRAVLKAEFRTVDGRLIRTVDSVATLDVIRSRSRGRIYEDDLPFGTRPIVAADHHTVFIGSGDSTGIGRYGASGQLLARIDYRSQDETLTARSEEDYLRRSLATIRWPEERRRLETLLREISWPDASPTFTALAVDEGGLLWVERAIGSYDGSVWDVHDPRDGIVLSVWLPPAFVPKWISTDAVLGVWTDSLGVDYVRRYDLSARN